MLVLQTVLWPLVLAKQPSQLLLRGGTHNPMAPSVGFLQHMAPYFSGQSQALFSMNLQRHGFYPAGGGEVHVQVHPPAQGLAAIDLMQRGEAVEAWAEALHSGIPKNVAERELGVLQHGLGWPQAQLRNRALRGNEGPGNALQVVLKYEHITEVVTGYGQKGVSAEEVARRVLDEVKGFIACQAPVGEHLADQLMIPMALATLQGRPGQFWTTCLSEHTRTNARVIEAFLPIRFEMAPHGDGHRVCTARQ